MKCGVHEELCELSGEARIGELRRVVRGVVAAHLSGVGNAFKMRLVPEGISLRDDESVAHLSAGGCVEVVPSPVQVLAKRGIPLHWDSVVEATRSKRYDDVGWLLQAGVDNHNVNYLRSPDALLPLQDATVLNLVVEHDVLLDESELTRPECMKHHMGTLVEAALARGSDRFKNDLLLALLSAPTVDPDDYYYFSDDSEDIFDAMVAAIPYCEALIPVSPLDETVTAWCARKEMSRFVGLLWMLLEHGAAVDRDVFVNLRGIIPLEAMRQLVQKGADPNADLLDGQFLGRKTEYTCELMNIKSLLACGMDIETVCSDGNTTILTRHVLADFGNVRKLVSLGANPNIFDEDGDTLAMHAAKRRHWHNLEALMQSDKIDVNQTSDDGLTVLMYVAGQQSQCGTRIVLAARQKPDLEVEDTQGRTCLAHASMRKGIPLPVVKLLLAHGAKVDGSATTCSPPLEHAVLKHSRNLCEMLLDNGADPLHMTSGEITCLELAESYSEETAELLRGYLAKTPPGQESRGVKRKREEPEPAVEEATESAQEQGSEEDEKKEEDATEHSCRVCGVAQTALGVPFASEASVRSHVTSKHRMKWSDYLRYEE